MQVTPSATVHDGPTDETEALRSSAEDCEGFALNKIKFRRKTRDRIIFSQCNSELGEAVSAMYESIDSPSGAAGRYSILTAKRKSSIDEMPLLEPSRVKA